jgi:hypothetical protein
MNTTFKPFKRLFLAFNLLMAFTLLLAMIPISASAASAGVECLETYKVTGHETIWRLVKKYDVSASRIAQANGLKPPYTLKIGQEICIPTKSAGSLSTSVSLSVSLSRDSVTIAGSGFPKAHTYNVKASSGGAWYRLVDNLRPDKNGELQKVRYKLPDELRGVQELSICLKDTSTNALNCVRATLPR